ncbi:hypothetical protein KDN24_20805 [Bacillus sp. Bva_UNVM-123]|uniref:hypothetical protein n=1 Tax=Bacillus sp. Bva_UNVM-123 TaxID=2829798 RepID=UPI00391F0342
MKKILSLLLTLVLILSVAVPFGSAQSNQPEDGYTFSQEEIDQIIATLENEEVRKEIEDGLLLQPYINTSGTIIEFDDVKALEDGLDPSLVQKVKEDYDRANEILAEQQPQFSTMAATLSSCGGATYFDGNWFGGIIYLDSCDANRAAAIVAGGGSITALVALLPGGAAVAGIAVAVFGLGAALILYNNAENTGVKINVVKNIANGDYVPYWIRPQ